MFKLVYRNIYDRSVSRVRGEHGQKTDLNYKYSKIYNRRTQKGVVYA